jgi:hypothetical protein
MPRLLSLLGLLAIACSLARAGSWPQFRGPGGLATPDPDRPLPDEIGPTQAESLSVRASDVEPGWPQQPRLGWSPLSCSR